ncbi:hypothetical protein [Cellulomonas chengniuliangii]|uniref:Uncharacterized protein n=1 Tax=Cellulomonas chengniuliangii TaxID=2968084 RepID=A0ABY5L5Z2_9CELL|nr:hypothetical protein [Cellulomonas chengniuliangii]MCC2307190.1 hypothetical protein [Cellulomonas chengniuliangii]UUI76013.1 hypothetical protein NP064_03655 [Cellulomonas chengniuliangii]
MSIHRSGASEDSAIDRAFSGLLVITQLAARHAPDWNPQHGLILSSSAVAVAEDYFRTLLTEVASACPLCTDLVRPIDTQIEFVLSGSLGDALRAALDRTSFSSASAIKEWTKKITGLDIKGRSSLTVELASFERVCHVRHCAIHAGGYVASHNAKVLSLPVGSWISFDSPSAIHDIVAVVAATVRAYNQLLFEHVLGRWIDEGLLTGVWIDDRDMFSTLWRTFRSKSDIESGILQGQSLPLQPFRVHQSMRPMIKARSAANG